MKYIQVPYLAYSTYMKIYSYAFEVSKQVCSLHMPCGCPSYPFATIHIPSWCLYRRLILLGIDSCFYNRVLRWAGGVERMPMNRVPRQLLATDDLN